MSDLSRPNSKSQVIILTLLHERLTPTQAAQRFGVSRKHIYHLLDRFQQAGMDALLPRSRRPLTNPRATPDALRAEILALREELRSSGFDAGSASIAHQLIRRHGFSPALSTIWRVMKAAGVITPAPKKRPKASVHRFEAVQPNETWQSDFTHWRLAGGKDVEIINWLDDHSRFLLACTAHTAITGKIVIEGFNACIGEYGIPFSTLTDNGNVYTARFTKGTNGFEYLLSDLGIVQKNGSPGHPQTQGKIERFHQTLKRYLDEQKPAKSIKELQVQLDDFRHRYNTIRPHKALEMKTPAVAYAATIKATPRSARDKEHYRIRYDHVDQFGKISLRRAGKMHHLGVGIHQQFKKVIVIDDHYRVTVVEKSTGEILSQHEITPSKSYWTNYLVDEETKKSRKIN